MTESSTDNGHAEAQRMLDIFASVSDPLTLAFTVTWTNAAGEFEECQKGVALADLRRPLPAILDTAIRQQRNVIVRPYGPGVIFIQLDDLKAPPQQDDLKTKRLAAVASVAHLMLETSPGNHQAWLAMPDDPAMQAPEKEDFIRRVKRGTGADPSASGATRIAGSINFKGKYAPNYPRVMIHAAQPGRTVTAAELERLELVAEPEESDAPPARKPPALWRRSDPANLEWPDYATCLERALKSQSRPGQPRESNADWRWCLIAATKGWPVDQIATQLMRESPKARGRQAYALQTANRAAAAAARNAAPRPQQRQHRIG
jgi:hypothetical protein